MEKFAGHADQILPASEPEDLPVPASSSGVASAKQHEQPSVEDSTHAKPPVVDSEDSLSPAEQSKLSGKAAPKQRGRPAKAKGKAKAKAEGKKREKASAKSKAKAKSKPKTLPDTEPASTSKPKKRTRAKAGSTEDDKAESATRKKSKKSEKIEKNTKATESLAEWYVRTAPAAAPKKKARKAKKAASKAKLEASADKVDDTNSTKNDPAQKTLEELPAVVRTKRARKSKPSATDACPLPEPEHDRHSAAADTTSDKGTEAKQRNARKSAAYRRAQKAAKDNGMSPADCAAAGRKVLCLNVWYIFWVVGYVISHCFDICVCGKYFGLLVIYGYIISYCFDMCVCARFVPACQNLGICRDRVKSEIFWRLISFWSFGPDVKTISKHVSTKHAHQLCLLPGVLGAPSGGAHVQNMCESC